MIEQLILTHLFALRSLAKEPVWVAWHHYFEMHSAALAGVEEFGLPRTAGSGAAVLVAAFGW